MARNGTLLLISAGHKRFMLYEVDGLGIYQKLGDERASPNPKWGRIGQKF